MNGSRLLRHLAAGWRPVATLNEIELQALLAQVQRIEVQHLAEVRICLEQRWPLAAAASGLTVRARAMQVFAELGVWDTEHNTGLLIYVDVADHAVEIVADRGLNAVVTPEDWAAVLSPMQEAFQRRQYARGLNRCLDTLDSLLTAQLPPALQSNPNELRDQPVLR